MPHHFAHAHFTGPPATRSPAGRAPRRRRGAGFVDELAFGGFSLIEVVVAVALVGGLFVAALMTLGAAKTAQAKMSDRSRGVLLAQDLMSEILGRRYEEPGGSDALGLDSGEAPYSGGLLAGSGRANFDDVDDYDKWEASPPQRRDGSAIPGFDGWSREAHVQWSAIKPDTLNATSASDTGVKRITVVVKHGDRTVAQLIAIRSRARPDRPNQAREVLPP